MNPLLGDARNFVVFETPGGAVVAGGQLRGRELASLVVAAGARGRGIGSAIVRAVVDICPPGEEMYLLCLDGRAGFYRRFGFELCAEETLPPGMRVERRLGDVVATFVAPGQKCVGMSMIR
jgi:predicted N-acetyltransferase YhbS